jgi:hypothetical protein
MFPLQEQAHKAHKGEAHQAEAHQAEAHQDHLHTHDDPGGHVDNPGCHVDYDGRHVDYDGRHDYDGRRTDDADTRHWQNRGDDPVSYHDNECVRCRPDYDDRLNRRPDDGQGVREGHLSARWSSPV